VLDVADARHAEADAFFTETRERIAVPSPVVYEVGRLAGRRLGSRVVARFARFMASGEFDVVDPRSADLVRAAALVDEYADLRLGLVDATLVAVAERLGVRTVATFDWRHFGVVRPRHGPLTLVP